MSDETQDELQDDGEYDGKTPGLYWKDQIEHARQVFDTWEARGDKVVARYRDERELGQKSNSKFNILWSNVQVLTPSLYGRPAKPEVSRRYRDADPIGRLASTMLERVLEYEIDQFPDFDSGMRGAVEDRLLPGRGTVWLRYEPVITSEAVPPPEDQVTSNVAPVENVDAAHAPVDYVYWKDFLHAPARTWDEVWWVARAVYMTKSEGVDRFGAEFKNVTLSEYREDHSKKTKERAKSSFAKKAKVWEIWNKRTAAVCWIAEGYDKQLDEKDDPLQLEGFFPCPKPIFATTTTGSLIPVPDYTEYQDQAEELDDLTGRIDKMVEAVKAVGVFNAEFKEIQRLLKVGVDNVLIPVGQWGALAEKGGLAGAVEMLDLTTVLQALGALYAARESVKQTIYEICGISDILRGTTKAEETLGAQQLKANFGSLRLRASQVDVARFASDIFKLKAQIVCREYPPELIIEMSGIAQTDDGRDPAMLQQALDLLRNSTVRDFHISVESDSLAQIDEAEEKAAATEAIGAIGGFIKEAIPMVSAAPETLPLVEAMLTYVARHFKAGRALESAIEQTMKALQQKAAKAAQNPQKSEAQIEAEAAIQQEQMRAQVQIQANQAKAQLDAQVQQAKLAAEGQLETTKAQQEERLAKLEGQLKLAEISLADETERYKAQLQSLTQLAVAEIGAASSAQSAEVGKETAKIKKGPATHPKLDELFEQVQAMVPQLKDLSERKPSKGKRVVRDADSKIVAIEEMAE